MSLDSHPFQSPAPNDSRSPCPALNSAASHGYLPRSGRDISFLQLMNATRFLYNISLPLALLLTCAAFIFCGRNGYPTIPFLGTIDLHDLARHGRIEHDGSLAHADAEPKAVFAPTTPDKSLLAELLNEARGKDALDLGDMARIRSQRDILLERKGRGLDWIHAELSRGEISLLLAVIGDGTKVSTKRLTQWLGQDRLPDGWVRPQKTQGLIKTWLMAKRVEAAVTAVRAGKVADR